MMTRLVSISALLLPLLFCASCGTDTDRTVIVAANEGNFVIKKEPNPLAGQAQAAPAPTSPTTKETAQQRRIDELEAQQRSLQTEIERLKAEKKTAAQ
jgi:Tfp pilus assembly protein FimV